MKNLPVFTTDYGVSSLTMQQIPYRGEAYIHVQTVQPGCLQAHIEECARFCRLAGAEKIYVSGGEGEPDVRVLELKGVPNLDIEKVENIFPVTEQTVGAWRRIVNERMAGVDLAAFLEAKDENTILESGGGYFIHSCGELLGVGWLQENTLKILAGVKPGAGERVAHTLLSVMPGESIRIEVASTNSKALHLYEKLGFLPVAELERWTQIDLENSK